MKPPPPRSHPSPGSAALRVFVDGASRGNPGPAALGVVLQDARGAVVAEVGEFLGEMTNNAAEYHALLRALDEARARGATTIEIFADSELLVQQVTGAYRVKSPLLVPLHQAVRRALDAFSGWRIAHVRRAQNAAADALANAAIDAARPSRHAELTVLLVRGDDGWHASVPALPGCAVRAPTRSEALARVTEAASARVAAAEGAGVPLPEEHRIRVPLRGDP